MSIKVLHTADWHIGKKLHEYCLNEDHVLFMDWIIEVIRQREIDFLLISGDVFDLANPSQDSLKIYYRFLANLSGSGCKAIITSGNHDSPALIDAPAQLLHALKIHVTGTVPEDYSDMVLPLYDKTGKLEACIASVPFLRDRDIRRSVEGETYNDRIQAVRSGISNFYAEVAELMTEKYEKVPHLAMGHLYAQGVSLSDSEREIQIGNLAGVDESTFPATLNYVALGHIHKTQNVGKENRVRYSGSPIPLSFSERNYHHKVILLEIKDNQINQEDIPVLRSRKLESLKGTFQEVKEKALGLQNDFSLPMLLDLYIEEENFDPQMSQLIEDLQKEIKDSGNKQVIYIRIKYTNTASAIMNPDKSTFKKEELTPEKIFSQLIAGREEEEQDKLMQIFMEIKQEAEETGSR